MKLWSKFIHYDSWVSYDLFVWIKWLLLLLHFHSRKSISKCRLRNGGHFVLASMCQYMCFNGNIDPYYNIIIVAVTMVVNLGALESLLLHKLHIIQCMGKIFCVEFQRYPLKFQTKYLTHTLKDMIFIPCWTFVNSQIYEFICIFET